MKYLKLKGLVVILFGIVGLIAMLGFVTGTASLDLRKEASEPDVVFTINTSDQRQEIDGFGGSSAFMAPWAIDNIPQSQLNQMYDKLFSPTDGIGVSIIRSRIDPKALPAVGQRNWGVINDSVSFMKEAKSRGPITFISTPWSPPAWMKTNGELEYGGSLKPEYYQEYANFLADYASYLNNTHNILLDSVSVQNEPDLPENYETAIWTGDQIRDFVKILGPALQSRNLGNVKVIVSEQYRFFNEGLAKPSLTDPGAERYIKTIASHGYGYAESQVDFTEAKARNKRIWQTENANLDTNSSSIEDGLRWAKDIHKYLTNPKIEANGYLYWWLVSNYASGSALVNYNNDQLIFHKRFYTFGNYSKFVRKNFRRVSTTPNQTGGVYISSFINPQDNSLVMVVVNENDQDRLVGINIGSDRSFTPWTTSNSKNLNPEVPINSVSGTLNAQLPAKSVTTFVEGGTAPPRPTPVTTPTPTPSSAPTPSPTTSSIPYPTPSPQSNCVPTLLSPQNNTVSDIGTTLVWESCELAKAHKVRFLGPGLGTNGAILRNPSLNTRLKLTSFITNAFRSGDQYTWSVLSCLNVNCTNTTAWSSGKTFYWQNTP